MADDEDVRYAEAERKVQEAERQWREWQQALWKSLDEKVQSGPQRTKWPRTDEPRKSFKQRNQQLLRSQPKIRAAFKRRVDWEKKQYDTLAGHVRRIWREFEATAESIVLNDGDDDTDTESEEDADFEPVSEEDDSEASTASSP